MFLATHAVTGAIIGRASPNPIIAFVGGFVSHFLLDMIPHGDSGLYKRYQTKQKVKRLVGYVTLDAIITAYLILGIREAHQFDDGINVTAGIIGSLLPDLIVVYYNIWKAEWLKWFYDLHMFFHNFFIIRKRDLSLKAGLVLQLIIVLLLQTRI